jgi:hypothetical protein
VRILQAEWMAEMTKPFDITTFLDTIERLLHATHERSVGN